MRDLYGDCFYEFTPQMVTKERPNGKGKLKVKFKSLGRCHYCDYAQTRAWAGTASHLVLTCNLCLKLLSPGAYRLWENEQPACAI